VAEFYQTDLMKNMRAYFIAGMLYNLKIKDINIDPVELLKTLFTEHYKNIYTPQLILTHLKGWPADRHFATDSFALLIGVLKKLPPAKWVSAQNLHDYISLRSIQLKAAEDYIISNYLYFEGTNKYGYNVKFAASSNSNL